MKFPAYFRCHFKSRRQDRESAFALVLNLSKGEGQWRGTKIFPSGVTRNEFYTIEYWRDLIETKRIEQISKQEFDKLIKNPPRFEKRKTHPFLLEALDWLS